MTPSLARFAVALLFLDVACSDDTGSAPSEGEASSAADTGSTSAGETSADSGAESSTTTGADESTSDGSDSGSTGSEPVEPEAIEIVIYGRDGGSPRAFFDYRRQGDTVQADALVEPGTAEWNGGEVLLSERRIVLGAAGQLFLGSLDGPAADVVAIDAAPIEQGTLTPATKVPGADAVVVTSETSGSAYRIDVVDGIATTPVAVAHEIEPFYAYVLHSLVDPTGRWFLFDRDVSGLNVALTRLDTPDANDVVDVTDEAPPFSARHLGFMPDGSGFAYVTLEEIAPREQAARGLWLAALDDDGLGTQTRVEAVEAPDDEVDRWVPHPQSLGFVHSIGRNGTPHRLSWCAVIDGVPQAPMELLAGGFFDQPLWSPNGEWLTVIAFGPATDERFVVHFADGEPGPATSVSTFDESLSDIDRAVFSPDSQYLYFEREEDGSHEIVRVTLTSKGWEDSVVVAGPGDDVQPGEIQDIADDGATLLYVDAGAGTVLAVDVSGPVPGEPVPISPPSSWVAGARFSPLGEFVAYEDIDPNFGPAKLMLVDLAAPGDAVEVIGDQLTWQFVDTR